MKQYKSHHCCSCKNYRERGSRVQKKYLCIIFWLTRRSQGCGKKHLCWLSYFVFLAVFMLALPHSAMKLRKKGNGGYGVRPCHSQIKGPSCTLHALLNLEVSLKFDMVFLQTLWGHDPTLCGCHARSRWPLAVSSPWQRTSWIRGGQLCSASVMGETPLVSFLCKNSASCSIMPNQNSYHECLTHLEKTK